MMFFGIVNAYKLLAGGTPEGVRVRRGHQNPDVKSIVRVTPSSVVGQLNANKLVERQPRHV